jgi:hypothetical protein
MTTEVKINANVAKQYQWDCYDTMEYEVNYSGDKFKHPCIRLFRRYGSDLKYITDMVTMEWQQNIQGTELVPASTVYAGHFDRLNFQDVIPASKLIAKINTAKEKLGLHSENDFQNTITALRSIGFREVRKNRETSDIEYLS